MRRNRGLSRPHPEEHQRRVSKQRERPSRRQPTGHAGSIVEVVIDPHARERMAERGASEDEVVATVLRGERFPAKYGRTGFRRNFRFDGVWRGRAYAMKQLEIFAVEDDGCWVVITVIVRFF